SILSIFLLSENIFIFFQAEDGIRDFHVTGVQTCALPILASLGFQWGRAAGSVGPICGATHSLARGRIGPRWWETARGTARVDRVGLAGPSDQRPPRLLSNRAIRQ